MKTFKVDVIATIDVRDIEAKTKEKAENIVMEMLANGEIDEGNAYYDFVMEREAPTKEAE